MRPIYLELQAFGPYVEHQIIDFQGLSRDGIFLIKGRTGSGKTTIFDAMMVALYGGGSGDDKNVKGGRNDLTEWRCRQADWSKETCVSFTFSVKGERYRFTRRLVPKRTSLHPQYEACRIDEEGKEFPFFNNPKGDELNKKAEEILGLTKEQFRQVVLLPQGQFERFLTASSDEKEEILKRIFAEERWNRYAQAFFLAANDRKNELTENKTFLDRSLSEEGFGSIAELEERIRTLGEKKEEGRKAHEAFDGEKRQAELDADKELAAQFKPLHELEKVKRELLLMKDGIEITKNMYNEAEKAEGLRGVIDMYESRKAEKEAREKAAREKREALPEAEKLVENAGLLKKTHEERSILPEIQRKLADLEAKRPFYESFEALEKKYAEAKKERDAADKALLDLNRILSGAVARAGELYLKMKEAEAEAANFRDRYFSGIYGELAAGLKTGEKCPVCGSIEHPAPAVRTPDSVTKEEWDARETAEDSAKKAWEAAETARGKKEEERAAAEKILSEKEGLLKSAEAELRLSRQSLIEGIADLSALEQAKKEWTKSLEDYNKQADRLAENLAEAERARDGLLVQIGEALKESDNAEELLSRAKGALNSALQEAGLTDYLAVKEKLIPKERRAAMHEEIVSYETSCNNNERDLAAKREELKGKTEPDSSLFEARRLEIKEEADSFNKESAALSVSEKRLSEKYVNLSKLEKGYRENISEAESDLAFAKKLRGDTGTGLQRYVLAVMFGKVIEHANIMLKQVHGGRYSLFRVNEGGQGHKKGLELRVHDRRSPDDQEGRPVSMLSGGEKFLVSLALSIGLSTVAQSSGVQIEALFIDEGFGTLDENSVNDAMAVLESVRRGNGLIGIISHVNLLESTINRQLEVVKEDSGNRIIAL